MEILSTLQAYYSKIQINKLSVDDVLDLIEKDMDFLKELPTKQVNNTNSRLSKEQKQELRDIWGDDELYSECFTQKQVEVTDKDVVISAIKYRIDAEYKKYGHKKNMQWSLITAKKLYGYFCSKLQPPK